MDVFEKSMGTFGRWHLWVCFWIFLSKFAVAWHQMVILIQNPPIEFWCADKSKDKCSSDCEKHEFNRTVFKETLTTEWDLVCKKKVLTDVVQMISMLGILVGNYLIGTWSDKYGRRYPLIIAVLIQLIFGCAQSFMPIFWIFLVFRFLTCFATGGTMITSFVLTMELIGLKYRTTVGILYQIPFYMGHMLLSPIAYFARDWKINQLVISVPGVLLCTYYWIMPESPRWLVTVNRVDEAISIMETIAKHNKRPTETIRDDVMEFVEKRAQAKQTKRGNAADLFRTPNCRRNWFCISFNWFMCGLCYFGVSQFVGGFAGDVFINVACTAVASLPGVVVSIFGMNYLGRQITLMGSSFISGVSLIVIAFLPKDWEIMRPAVGAVGMFGLAIVFPTIYIYSGELFPTIIRNVAVGTSSMCARVGSMMAPYIPDVAGDFIASMIFGITPLIAMVLCYFLPETLNCRLPDSIEEAEKFTKEHRGSVMTRRRS